MLGKLVGYCESVQEYEAGIVYGQQILKHDGAHERTYCHLMRLYYLAGDRTRALRQFQRCARVLHEELGIEPSERTMTLYQQIQAGRPIRTILEPRARASIERETVALPNTLDHLNQIKMVLLQAQHQLDLEIEAVTAVLDID
jgi:DNA-binding SARP family transcriptional activator